MKTLLLLLTATLFAQELFIPPRTVTFHREHDHKHYDLVYIPVPPCYRKYSGDNRNHSRLYCRGDRDNFDDREVQVKVIELDKTEWRFDGTSEDHWLIYTTSSPVKWTGDYWDFPKPDDVLRIALHGRFE